MKIRLLFAWYDLWIGVFWDRKTRRLYVLPLPCVGIVVEGMGYDLMARPCDQCLLSAQKIVSDVRRRQILAETARKDCAFLCHKGTIAGRQIVCRAHYDASGGGQLGRIARRLGAIREIDPETLEPS